MASRHSREGPFWRQAEEPRSPRSAPGPGSLPSSAFAAERLIPRDRIGIQLFTVRTLAEADLPGTLRCWPRSATATSRSPGSFGRTPAQFRALMQANKLRAIGGHQLVGPALIPFFGERARSRTRSTRPRPSGSRTSAPPASRSRPASSTASARPRRRPGTGSSPSWRTSGVRPRRRRGHEALPARALLGVRDRSADRPSRCSRSCSTRRIRGTSGSSPTCSGWSSAVSIRWTGSRATRTASRSSTSRTASPNPAGGYFNPGFTDLGEGSIDFRPIFKALRRPATTTTTSSSATTSPTARAPRASPGAICATSVPPTRHPTPGGNARRARGPAPAAPLPGAGSARKHARPSRCAGTAGRLPCSRCSTGPPNPTRSPRSRPDSTRTRPPSRRGSRSSSTARSPPAACSTGVRADQLTALFTSSAICFSSAVVSSVSA